MQSVTKGGLTRVSRLNKKSKTYNGTISQPLYTNLQLVFDTETDHINLEIISTFT